MDSKILEKLNKLVGTQLTLNDYADWLEGGDRYEAFDNAALTALGEGLYNAGQGTARLPDLLDAFLMHPSPVPKNISVKAGGYFIFKNLNGCRNRA